MPARPWKDRSNNTAVTLRARIRYLRQSNNDLRGQISKLSRENSELKEKLQELENNGEHLSRSIDDS